MDAFTDILPDPHLQYTKQTAKNNNKRVILQRDFD